MSLYLSYTLSLSQPYHPVRELFCPSRGLVRVKAFVHFVKLAPGSEAYLLFDVNSAWSNKSWIKSIKMIGCHEDEPLFRGCHTI